MKLNYECLFNELPLWMRISILAELIVFNIGIIAAIIVVIYFKYEIYKYDKNKTISCENCGLIFDKTNSNCPYCNEKHNK
jgi:hypothetical protein